MIYFFLLLCLFAVVGMAFARRALARSAERADSRRELAARARHHAAASGAGPVQKLISDEEELAVLDERIRQLEKRRDWSEVASALEERAQLVTGQERVETFVHLLAIYRDRFANHTLAAETAESILEIDPEHEQALAARAKR